MYIEEFHIDFQYKVYGRRGSKMGLGARWDI
jgi:hypothetical protein